MENKGNKKNTVGLVSFLFFFFFEKHREHRGVNESSRVDTEPSSSSTRLKNLKLEFDRALF